jgi:2-keto-myo-inositol isomerase
VMCPNNDKNDHRDARSRVEETLSALKAYGPSFKKRGILGLVEPLGFRESSLSSIVVAAETIKKAGFDCYKIAYDTFHFYLGPDNENDVDAPLVSRVGLIHVSGVEASVPKETWRDEQRVLLSNADLMASRDQIDQIVALGYEGDISFEPFSAEVQRMSRDALASALRKSIEFLS